MPVANWEALHVHLSCWQQFPLIKALGCICSTMIETFFVVGNPAGNPFNVLVVCAPLFPMNGLTSMIILAKVNMRMDTGSICPCKWATFSCGASCRTSLRRRTPNSVMLPHSDSCPGSAISSVNVPTCSSRNV